MAGKKGTKNTKNKNDRRENERPQDEQQKTGQPEDELKKAQAGGLEEEEKAPRARSVKEQPEKVKAWAKRSGEEEEKKAVANRPGEEEEEKAEASPSGKEEQEKAVVSRSDEEEQVRAEAEERETRREAEGKRGQEERVTTREAEGQEEKEEQETRQKSEGKREKRATRREAGGRKGKKEKAGEGEKHISPFPVVAIGASAGGVDALKVFFNRMPKKQGIAFVVITHMDPKRKSYMDELIQRHTPLPVTTISEGMKIEADTVYVNPPDKQATVSGGVLHLSDLPHSHEVRLPIDRFLRSLAEDQKENAICIILSGTGSDGTSGVREIKGNAGMVMVQDPQKADYSGMPQSAIDTGLVDFILPVERMPDELLQYLKHPLVKQPEEIETGDEQFEYSIQKIFRMIRNKTGHDFTNYKQNTIRRRIERRMAVHKVVEIKNYVRLLNESPIEIDFLFKDLLIKVTSFFRDPEAFEALKTEVIPKIMNQKPDGSNLRIWVPGCATGEEAFSIAMLLVEVMDQMDNHLNVQIFASDIDSEAIHQAREAQYPESITNDVNEERLSRFFLRDDSKFKVKKQIRQMVTFAVQNLLTDPPFSKLDLVSCRNLLIYMDSSLQKKILPLFHYTLNSGGYLFLGTSETTGEFGNLFQILDKKWKLYQRRETEGEGVVHYPPLTQIEAKPTSQQVVEVRPAPLKKEDFQNMARRILMEDYTPPSVIIDDEYRIVYFHGLTDKYLTLPRGEASFYILDMAREGLRYRLKAAIDRAIEQRRQITSQGVRLKEEEDSGYLDLTVRPLLELREGKYGREERPLFLVVFQEKAVLPKESKKRKGEQAKGYDPKVAALEQRLQSTREDLQTTIEELETSNEELKSANEEAQSTNEELETSREELQSTNEELTTVNTELQSKLEELSKASNDINNLLTNTEIGIIFLDSDLRISRYTPAIRKALNLIPSDIGRPISDISLKIPGIDFNKDSRQVLDSLQTREAEVKSDDSKWFYIRIMPYRTTENKIEGVVITLFDITQNKQSQREAEAARMYAESIVNAVREPLLILDQDLKIISANKAFYRTFQTQEEETLHRKIYHLGNGQWDIPDLRRLLEEIIPQNSSFDDFKVSHTFPGIGPKVMMLNARMVRQEDAGQRSLVLLAIEDVTDRQPEEAEREEGT